MITFQKINKQIGDYKIEIEDISIKIESLNWQTKLGGKKVNGLIYADGKIAYDYPEWLPKYVKEKINKTYDLL